MNFAMEWPTELIESMMAERIVRIVALGLLFVIPLLSSQARNMAIRKVAIASGVEYALGLSLALVLQTQTYMVELTHDWEPWSAEWVRAYIAMGFVAFVLSFVSYRVPSILWRHTIDQLKSRGKTIKGFLLFLFSVSFVMLIIEQFFYLIGASYPLHREPSIAENIQAGCIIFVTFMFLAMVAGLVAIHIERHDIAEQR